MREHSILGLAVALLVLAGCATGAGATAVAPSVDADASPAQHGPAMELTSPAFTNGGAIPRRYTCDGPDVSPPLAWSGVPAGTVSLALIVDDPDARGFVHWVAFGLPARAGSLAESVSGGPAAPREGRNDFGRSGWGGPCPPSGTHRYRFTLLALDRTVAFSGSPGAGDVRASAAGHTLATATLVGTYRRG